MIGRTMFTPLVLTPFKTALAKLVETKKRPRGLLVRVLLFFLAACVALVFTVALPLTAQVMATGEVLLDHALNVPILIAIVVMGLLDVAAWWTVAQSTPATVQQVIRDLAPHVQAALQSTAHKSGQTAGSTSDAEAQEPEQGSA